jgi:hypothetical protein
MNKIQCVRILLFKSKNVPLSGCAFKIDKTRMKLSALGWELSKIIFTIKASGKIESKNGNIKNEKF